MNCRDIQVGFKKNLFKDMTLIKLFINLKIFLSYYELKIFLLHPYCLGYYFLILNLILFKILNK